MIKVKRTFQRPRTTDHTTRQYFVINSDQPHQVPNQIITHNTAQNFLSKSILLSQGSLSNTGTG